MRRGCYRGNICSSCRGPKQEQSECQNASRSCCSTTTRCSLWSQSCITRHVKGPLQYAYCTLCWFYRYFILILDKWLKLPEAEEAVISKGELDFELVWKRCFKSLFVVLSITQIPSINLYKFLRNLCKPELFQAQQIFSLGSVTHAGYQCLTWYTDTGKAVCLLQLQPHSDTMPRPPFCFASWVNA